MYFKQMPKIKYPWEDKNGKFHGAVVPDIFRRVQLDKFFKNRTLLIEIFLDDKDTPESVAHDYYGSVNYHWIVLLFNKYFDRYYEWPMPIQTLQKYVSDKYTNPNAIHHYETSQSSGDTNVKIKVEVADVPTATPVTNYEYEQDLNDARKQIHILQPGYLPTFISDFRNLVSSQV